MLPCGPVSERAADELPPRIGAADAVALSRALVLSYDAFKRPDASLRKPIRALRDACDVLRVAWEARVRIAIGRDHGVNVRRADLDEDAVWAALFHFLLGWSELPPHLCPQSEKARDVLRVVFPDGGVSFTELTYALEWAEAERRLALLDTEGHVAQVEALGGAPLLAALYRAHREYERVLGVSHADTETDDVAGHALADLAAAVRDAAERYLSTVRALADRAQREVLEAPLRRWLADREWRMARHSRA